MTITTTTASTTITNKIAATSAIAMTPTTASAAVATTAATAAATAAATTAVTPLFAVSQYELSHIVALATAAAGRSNGSGSRRHRRNSYTERGLAHTSTALGLGYGLFVGAVPFVLFLFSPC